jgi:hypothetical protein
MLARCWALVIGVMRSGGVTTRSSSCACGWGCVAARWPACGLMTSTGEPVRGVPSVQSPLRSDRCRNGRLDRAAGLQTRGDRGVRGTPAAPCRSVRHGPSQRSAASDRAGAAPPELAAQAQPVLATAPVDVTVPLTGDGLRMVKMGGAQLVGGRGCRRGGSPRGAGPSGDSRVRAGRSGCIRTIGRSGCGSRVGSLPTCKRSIRRARSRRRTCSRFAASAPPRTCSHSRTSADCCRRHGSCATRCARRAMRRCSGCSPYPACGSARRSRAIRPVVAQLPTYWLQHSPRVSRNPRLRVCPPREPLRRDACPGRPDGHLDSRTGPLVVVGSGSGERWWCPASGGERAVSAPG